MPSRFLVIAAGLLLLGLGVAGLMTGRVLGRSGPVQRAGDPVWFWFRVILYLGLGALCLRHAWTQYA